MNFGVIVDRDGETNCQPLLRSTSLHLLKNGNFDHGKIRLKPDDQNRRL